MLFTDFYQRVLKKIDRIVYVPNRLAINPLLKNDVGFGQQLLKDRKAGGVADRFSQKIDDVSPIFALRSGGRVYGAAVCFTTRIEDRVSSISGAPIVQPADRTTWGRLLAPGSYSRLDGTSETDDCFYEDGSGHYYWATDLGGLYRWVGSVTPRR